MARRCDLAVAGHRNACDSSRIVPPSVCSSLPDTISQTVAFWSMPPATRNCPFGSNASDVRLEPEFANRWVSRPVAASQTRIAPSLPAVASVRFFGSAAIAVSGQFRLCDFAEILIDAEVP